MRPPSPERADENLALREDPRSGFYVAGLQEYPVRNYAEAAELLNWGLSNRIMASTHMNITSSRSHTVLCLAVTQRQEGGDEGAAPAPGGPRFSRTLRSKLMLVDLAGSERVRRTSSRCGRPVAALLQALRPGSLTRGPLPPPSLSPPAAPAWSRPRLSTARSRPWAT